VSIISAEFCLSLIDNPGSKYYIIKFYEEGYEKDEIAFFVIDINKYGFVKANIIFPKVIALDTVLPMIHKIHYHSININTAGVTKVTDKVRIKVDCDDFSRRIILEADDQCWYKPVNDGVRKNVYYVKPLRLLLFSQINNLDNCERRLIYAPLYEAQYRYFNLFQQMSVSDVRKFDSEEERVKYKNWEEVELKKRREDYFHLLHNEHPIRSIYDKEEFMKWAKKTEKDYHTRNK